MAQINLVQPKIFPLEVRKVGGYDYGAPTSYSSHHLGVDWVAHNVVLRAPCAGEILRTFVGTEGGNTIWFRPEGEKTIIRWLHLSQFKCKAGQLVVQGQPLAITGNTGLSEGGHLHEDIWKSAVTLKYADTINPHTYYPPVDG